ncbi:hypothetical protein D3C85_1534880 [compost metagenome]
MSFERGVITPLVTKKNRATIHGQRADIDLMSIIPCIRREVDVGVVIENGVINLNRAVYRACTSARLLLES